LAVATVRHVHRSLRKALNDAVLIDGVLSSNPALLAKLPKETRRTPRRMWTAEDLDVFLESTSNHRLHAFFRVAAFTRELDGERCCTCGGLTWTSRRARSDSKARQAWSTTKGGRS
jgi:hypothetical protein